MAVYNNNLCAGTLNASTGTEIWEYSVPTSPDENKGSIFGTVVNKKNGNPVASVKITLKGKSAKSKIKASTDDDGSFEFDDLEVDTYKLKAQKNGFRKYTGNIEIEEGEYLEITIEMKKKNRE